MWSCIKRHLFMYSTCNVNLQIFLDEAIWRIKHKSFQERIEFLIQINSFYGAGEDAFANDIMQDCARMQSLADSNIEKIEFTSLYESIWD